MSRKFTTPDGYDILKRYNAIFSCHQIASELGVTIKVVQRLLAEKGIIDTSRKTSTIARSLAETGVSESEVLDMFKSGIGVRGVFEKLGVSINAVNAILERNGIATRNRSEQQFARMANASPEERKRLAKAANEAAKGRVRSFEEKCKMAATFESIGARRESLYEDALAFSFLSGGLTIVRQKAIGPYNCDIAIDSIAVEVFGGHWHWHGEHLARTEERFRYIMNAGFDILVVPFSDSFPFSERTASYLVDLINKMRCNPAPARQYRVIWGAGDFITGGGLDDDKISIDPPFTSARDYATGRYKRVPR